MTFYKTDVLLLFIGGSLGLVNLSHFARSLLGKYSYDVIDGLFGVLAVLLCGYALGAVSCC